MAATNGHANLVPAEKGNLRAVKHGLHSERTLAPEVREIADEILAIPHLSAVLDEIGVVELARVPAVSASRPPHLPSAFGG